MLTIVSSIFVLNDCAYTHGTYYVRENKWNQYIPLLVVVAVDCLRCQIDKSSYSVLREEGDSPRGYLPKIIVTKWKKI